MSQEKASVSPIGGQFEALKEEWRRYFEDALSHDPAHPGARDFLKEDLNATLARLIPEDASVLEVGCGRGDLIASLSNDVKVGQDMLPSAIAQAKDRHPGMKFEVSDILEEPVSGTPVEKFDAVICDRLGHSVMDVLGLLEGLGRCLHDDGRIYLVTFNYLWELPTKIAEKLGMKVPAPTSNWLSETDFDNLFELADLEAVRFEDRLMVPVQAGIAGHLVNKYLARIPGWQNLTLYRVYVLRKKPVRLAATTQTSASTEAGPSTTVIVPARNEAGNILAAVERTPQMGAFTELIFVEGGSSDDTWETIQRVVDTYKGPLKLSYCRQTGKGKGDAVRLGFSKAKGDILMILDADLTVPPEDLPRFYRAAAERRADYVQGTRLVYPMENRAMRAFNKMGNIAFSKLFSYLLQQPIKDTLCGTKVLWRKDYERLAAARSYFGDFDPFGDFDLIFGAARLNLKIGEIPVRYRERVYGETNIDRWSSGWLLLKMCVVAARKLRYV